LLWNSNTVEEEGIEFPGVLVCPFFSKGPASLPLAGTSCEIFVQGESGQIPCSVFNVTMSKGKTATGCLNFNYDVYSNFTVEADMETYMLLNFLPQDNTLLAVTVYSQHNVQIPSNLVPSSGGSLDKAPLPGFPKSFHPAFLAAAGNIYYTLLTKSSDFYAHGYVEDHFSVGVSSTAMPGAFPGKQKTNILVSYATLNVLTRTQFPGFDWIALLGAIGGGASLIKSTEFLLLAIIKAIRNKCCCSRKEAKTLKINDTEVQKLMDYAD